MKYKIGDKVRVKDGLKPDKYGVTPSMLGYCGEVMTVKSTDSILSAYYLVEDNAEFIWHEDILEPADSKTLRMADGTIIGDFNTGGFCDGFRGGKIPTPEKPASIEEQLGLPKGVSIHDLDMTSLYRPMNIEIQPLELVCNEEQAKEIAERLNEELARYCNAFSNDGISAKNGGKNSMKFTFYVTEGTRVDKSCNGTIPTMTTMVSYIDKYGCIMKGTATCDKADYDERQGVLEALANATCGDNFYKAYAEAIKFNRYEDELSRTCAYCGQLLDTREEREEHEAWHVERKKARRERYLLRKRAKEIAFEEQAQKMAKEMIKEDK